MGHIRKPELSFKEKMEALSGRYRDVYKRQLQSVVEGVTEPPVTLEQDVAQKLSRKVLETYLKVLKDGGASYEMCIRDRN